MKDSLKLAMADKLKLVVKTLFVQIILFCALVFLFWGSQKFYSFIDQTTFPDAYPIPNAEDMDDKTKGKILELCIRDSPSDAPAFAQRTAMLGHKMAHFGNGAVPIVRGRFDQHRCV